MSTTDDLFSEPAPSSKIKVDIVVSYLNTRHAIMKGKHDKLGYFDLFCGPGAYENGAESTPLQVLRDIIGDPDLAAKVVTIFNDADNENARAIQQAISQLAGVERLASAPQVYSDVVGDRLAEWAEGFQLIPAFVFIDPFGYKGVSQRLIGSFMKDHGMECMVFCNYSRLNAAIDNSSVRGHVDALLGADRAARVAEAVRTLSPVAREEAFMEAVVDSMREAGSKYCQSFRFLAAGKNRTSHYLLFLTNHPRGHKKMKEEMAKRGQVSDDGVPLYTFDPKPIGQTTLPMDFRLPALKRALLEHFAGRTISVSRIIEEHHPNTPYIPANYKKALLAMEQAGQVTVERPDRAHKGTMGDRSIVTFPE